jgi:hypothetical protein
MKFHTMTDNEQELKYVFQCPGCGGGHWVRARGPEPCWAVSSVDTDYPTVNPSILVRGSHKGKPTVCHSFVRDGKIQFLNDCTHELAGQTVEIPDFDD